MLVGDERAEDSFTLPRRDSSACTTASASSTACRWGWWGGAAGTGTVMRPETVRRYADEAGFSGCEVLPIENDFWRFYLLRP